MSEMIERVARAIAPTMFDPYNVRWYWELWAEQGQKDARAVARKAIEAMREPTGTMVACAHGAGWHGGIEGDKAIEGEFGAAIYRAMIDVALKG